MRRRNGRTEVRRFGAVFADGALSVVLGLGIDAVILSAGASIAVWRLGVSIPGTSIMAGRRGAVLPGLGAAGPGSIARLGGRFGLGAGVAGISAGLASRAAALRLALRGIRAVASIGICRSALARFAAGRLAIVRVGVAFAVGALSVVHGLSIVLCVVGSVIVFRLSVGIAGALARAGLCRPALARLASGRLSLRFAVRLGRRFNPIGLARASVTRLCVRDIGSDLIAVWRLGVSIPGTPIRAGLRGAVLPGLGAAGPGSIARLGGRFGLGGGVAGISAGLVSRAAALRLALRGIRAVASIGICRSALARFAAGRLGPRSAARLGGRFRAGILSRARWARRPGRCLLNRPSRSCRRSLIGGLRGDAEPCRHGRWPRWRVAHGTDRECVQEQAVRCVAEAWLG